MFIVGTFTSELIRSATASTIAAHNTWSLMLLSRSLIDNILSIVLTEFISMHNGRGLNSYSLSSYSLVNINVIYTVGMFYLFIISH